MSTTLLSTEMARTIADIQQQIIDTYVQEMAAIGEAVEPTTWSNTSLEKLWSFVVAFCIWVHEKLFDALMQEVRLYIEKMKPHTPQWYAETALAFQLGFPTLPDTWLFDNTGKTAAQIAASKVVKYVAVTEEELPGYKMFLRMKLAGANGNELDPLPVDTVTAVREYFNKKAKDAGVKMVFESRPPDAIRMEWDVYIDPTILSATGARLDGSEPEPVREAILAYMKELPFNGIYVPVAHQDKVQGITGVNIPLIKKVEYKYGNLDYKPVLVEYRPDAGWLRFAQPQDLVINYIIHS